MGKGLDEAQTRRKNHSSKNSCSEEGSNSYTHTQAQAALKSTKTKLLIKREEGCHRDLG
jgi:hypothetical protein